MLILTTFKTTIFQNIVTIWGRLCDSNWFTLRPYKIMNNQIFRPGLLLEHLGEFKLNQLIS